MATTVILQAHLLLSLCCMAWGILDLPKVIRVHAGQKTHILCTHTCQEADSCNVQLDWIDRPPEFRSLEGYYNTTHHSLKMNVQAGSQETDIYRYITCVAKTTDGHVIEEDSTRLEICPAETLSCRFDMKRHQASNIVSYVFACEYKSKCGTKMHCQSNREGLSSSYLGVNKTGSWYVEVYEIIGLMPGDNVTCRLHSPSIEEHLQTSFELMLPEESSPELTTQALTTPAHALTNPALTTHAQMNQASTTQVPVKETKTYPTPAETPTKPPLNQCPVNSCDCAVPWVLFALTWIVLIGVSVGIVYNKYCKNEQGCTLPSLPRYCCKDTD
ncbi:uncharacterized protein LOC119731349 [Patiria miniata]|uniref:Uncharacterized protein n=1 Tax=Patiria miniata TaxID=46514 RepID=A0A914AAJ1_PATMI|nr:uncharacterized protein LOC119731349 [Patiria miniata]